MPGRLTTTIVASCAIRSGSRQEGKIGQAVGADQEEQIVVRGARGGPIRASRRCSAGRDAWSRSPRPRTSGARRSRSGPSPADGPPRSVRPACAAARRRPRTRPGPARTPPGTARPGSSGPGGSGQTCRQKVPVASTCQPSSIKIGPPGRAHRVHTISRTCVDRRPEIIVD